MIFQALSLVGAALLLAAYAGHQLGWRLGKGLIYSFLNFAGSAMVTVSAIAPLNLGVVILEGVWAIVSAIAVVRLLRALRKPQPA
jgi:hypothetical protein